MVSKEFYKQLEALAEEKGLSVDRVLKAFEDGLIKGYRREHGNTSVRVEFRPEKHELNMYSRRIVVNSYDERDPEIDILPILLVDAKKLNHRIKVGDILEEPVNIKDYSRLAAVQVKQILRQNIQLAERESVYQYFKDLENEMIGAQVIDEDDEKLLLNLGQGVTTFLPRKNLLKNDKYHKGDRINVYITNVENGTKNVKVFVSRNDNHFLTRLLEQYVPEIKDGVVEIKGIARDAGDRTKIGLYSNDPNVEAIGSVVGKDSERINAVKRALGGENIDLFEWSDDIKERIKNSLQPAKVIAVINVDMINKTSLAIVPDNQLSLAIGQKGQNVRLAVQAINFKVDIKSESIAREQGYEWD